MVSTGHAVQLQVCGQQTLSQILPQGPEQSPCQVQQRLWLCLANGAHARHCRTCSTQSYAFSSSSSSAKLHFVCKLKARHVKMLTQHIVATRLTTATRHFKMEPDMATNSHDQFDLNLGLVASTLTGSILRVSTLHHKSSAWQELALLPDRIHQVHNVSAVVAIGPLRHAHVVCSQQGSLAACPICC